MATSVSGRPADLKVVIPSRGRASKVATKTFAMFPTALVTVDEKEVDDYAEFIPRESILPHPGRGVLPRLGMIRQWVVDTVDADLLVMLDDDVIDLRCMVGWRPRTYRYTDPDTPAVALAVLEATGVCARDAGCGIFGFPQVPISMHFSPQQPFGITRRVSGATIGFVRGHGLRFDPLTHMHDDVDLSLQSLVKHRILWTDERWCFSTEHAKTSGGNAGFRNSTTHRIETDYIKAKWGQYVEVDAKIMRYRGGAMRQPTTESTRLSVKRRQGLPSEA